MNPQQEQQQQRLTAIIADKVIFDYIQDLLMNFKVKGENALLHGQAILAFQNSEKWNTVLNNIRAQIKQEEEEIKKQKAFEPKEENEKEEVKKK